MPFNHFDFISPIYERYGHFDRTHPLMALLEMQDKGMVIDIGGGTGRIAQALTGDGRHAIVVDLSPGMLLRVHDKPDLSPLMADAAALPFRAGSADRVLIVDALHHIKDQPGTIRELCRLLKPGGVGVVVEPDTRVFVVKLIAIMEFVLLMGSHFLKPDELLSLFSSEPGTTSLTAWRGNLLLQFKKKK
jgi:ubiquinone/menaquinone biosynthesis C-methylase UbiE